MTAAAQSATEVIFGEPISIYTREQAIEDGVLVDVTEWASASKGFIGGFTCPVAITRAVWTLVDIDSKKGNRTCQSTRGRAHDVLFMSSLAIRRAFARKDDRSMFIVRLGRKNERLLVVADGDGITIGNPSDF